MKSNLRSWLSVVFSTSGLALSLPAQCLVMDYVVDETSNVVTTGTLEWLQWDVTSGMSIAQAQAQYSADGWRLASDSEMAGLFEGLGLNYHLGEFASVDQDENTSQMFWDDSASIQFSSFLDSFGITSHDCYDQFYPDIQCVTSTSALYGNDLDQDQLFGFASISYSAWNDAVTGELTGYPEAYSQLGADIYSDSFSSSGGVALVRDVVTAPLPPSATLFAGALAALAWFRRRRLSTPRTAKNMG